VSVTKSTLPDEINKIEKTVDVVSRCRKSADELAGKLFQAFAASVEMQVAQGEITPGEQSALIQIIEGADLTIRDDVGIAIKKLIAEEETLKQLGTAVIENGKSRGALARRLTWSILSYMQDKGYREIAGEFTRFKIKKNPVRLVINETLIPDEWKKDEIKRVPDRARIEAALDAGEVLDFAHYEQAERLEVK
jgi:hypothetical protein